MNMLRILSLSFLFVTYSAHAALVLIDPGHGGRDRGAEVAGLFEADVVWPWALSLKRELSRLGIQSQLSRNEKTVSLAKKRELFQSEKFDLVISLHANFFYDPRTQGVEYFLRHPLSLEDQKLKLAFEEQTDSSLEIILRDLSRQGKLRQSLRMAQNFQRQWPGKIQQGAFEVLDSSHAPTVLVELGYLSHSLERANLQNPQYIQSQSEKLARAIQQSLIDVKQGVF